MSKNKANRQPRKPTGCRQYYQAIIVWAIVKLEQMIKILKQYSILSGKPLCFLAIVKVVVEQICQSNGDQNYSNNIQYYQAL